MGCVRCWALYNFSEHKIRLENVIVSHPILLSSQLLLFIKLNFAKMKHHKKEYSMVYWFEQCSQDVKHCCIFPEYLKYLSAALWVCCVAWVMVSQFQKHSVILWMPGTGCTVGTDQMWSYCDFPALGLTSGLMVCIILHLFVYLSFLLDSGFLNNKELFYWQQQLQHLSCRRRVGHSINYC